MRVVFFGTPGFAVPSLRALLDAGHDVAAVVTQPDRPQGRSRSLLVPPPVKEIALAHRLPVHQPERPMGDLFLQTLRRAQADLGVVVAYGHILRPAVLAVPPGGMINVHASLLPRWRGAAPIQAAILAGDSVTGVSVMQMEAGLDSGPVLLRAATPIGPQETAGELADRLAQLGADTLLEAMGLLEDGSARPEPQDGAAATFAPKVTREAARLDWMRDAAALARATRAYDPAPGAWALRDGEPVKLFRGSAVDGAGRPGTVLAVGETLRVATAAGVLEVRDVQPAGKRRMPAAEWTRGRGVEPGTRFG
ncbi:MAG TPA: methionyl-tRNA formyltransferase [Gemmatimonadales bacterium]|nr:methionyl-tRNA formyltransferase [Gemmatimonadales bacterium]